MIKLVRMLLGPLVINGVGLTCGILLVFLIGKYLGPEAIGIINLSSKILIVLVVLGIAGVRLLVLRENSINNNSASKSFSVSLTVNTILSIIILSVFLLINLLIDNFNLFEKYPAFYVGIFVLILPIAVLNQLLAAYLAAKKKPSSSIFIDKNGTNIIVLLILITYYFINKEFPNIVAVLYIYIISRIIVFVYGVYILNRCNKQRNIKLEKPFISIKYIVKSRDLFFTSLLGVVTSSAATFIILILFDVKTVGVFAVANRLASLIHFVENLNQHIFARKFAKLYKENKIDELKKQINNTRFGYTIFSSIISLFLIILGKELLKLIGNEFANGYYWMVILSFATVIKLSCGPNGKLLVMSGNEKILRKIKLITSINLVILLFSFGCLFGVYGICIAMIFQSSLENFLTIRACNKYIFN